MNRQNRINRAIKQLAAHGLRAKKKFQNPYPSDWGEYMIMDINENVVVAGKNFELTLEDVEQYISEFK